MKRVIVICDGMADEASESLGGKTPLEFAATPTMDRLARSGRCGSLQTVPGNFYPGSEVAILTILGYSTDELPLGRAPLEALGLGMILPEGYTALRYQLNKESSSIIDLCNGIENFSFKPISSTKGICILPTHSLSCLPDSEDIEFWSGDTCRKYGPAGEKHTDAEGNPGKVAIIGAVPLLAGIAHATNADWIKPEGADGTTLSNFSNKATAAIEALKSHDMVVVHIEACDHASHNMDINAKIKAIEDIDRLVIRPLMSRTDNNGILNGDEKIAIAVMSDHLSLCSTGCHSRGNSPFLYYYPGITGDCVMSFDENKVQYGSLKEISEIYD